MSTGASAAGVDLQSASGADAEETAETARTRAVWRRRKEDAGREE
jgi:hypothetical protein